MNASPITNSPCRLLHSTKSGTMIHMAFPPRNRYRSTSNSVKAEKANVTICTRGPQIGKPAMTPMSMPMPRTARLGWRRRAFCMIASNPSHVTAERTSTMSPSPPMANSMAKNTSFSHSCIVQ